MQKTTKQNTILITGNAGALGQKLTKKLLQKKYTKIIGVDRRDIPNPPAGLEHHALDLRRKSALELLHKIKPQIIIHLGVIRNPHIHRNKKANAYYFNLETTTQLLRLAEKLPIKKFIFLSSANLYGPSSATTGLLTEDAPLHGANKSPEFRDLVSLDMMIQSFFWKQPNTQTIILRPCHIVGTNLKNAPSRYLTLETIPTILGFDPLLQLIHAQDLIDAIILSLENSVRGIFNLAGPDISPLSRIIKKLGRQTIPVPEKLLKLLVAGNFFSRRSMFPASELDHLKYNCLIDCSRAQSDLNFKPKKNISNIILDLKKIN